MKRRVLVVGAVVTTVVVCGGVASAYLVVSSVGVGEGKVAVAGASESEHIKVVLGSNPGPLRFGKPVALSGSFDNPNVPVTVRSVTVTITGTTKSGCKVSDFALSRSATAVNAVVPVGTHVGSWDGITLMFRNDPHRDQSACLGADVQLRLTSN